MSLSLQRLHLGVAQPTPGELLSGLHVRLVTFASGTPVWNYTISGLRPAVALELQPRYLHSDLRSKKMATFDDRSGPRPPLGGLTGPLRGRRPLQRQAFGSYARIVSGPQDVAACSRSG